MERCIYIKNFKNIGIEKEERFVLNRSLEDDATGNLVIVVGPNNVGKTNMLNAHLAFKNEKFEKDDITNITYSEEARIPEITLCVKNDSGNQVFSYSIVHGKSPKISYPDSMPLIKENEKEIASDLLSILKRYNLNNFAAQISEAVNCICSDNTDKNEKAHAFKKVEEAIIEIRKTVSNHPFNHVWESLTSAHPEIKKIYSSDKSMLNTAFEDKHGMPFIPTIYNYIPENISGKLLKCSSNSINNFIATVLNAIGISVGEVRENYKRCADYSTSAFRTTLEKEANERLEKLANHFNTLFYADPGSYRFEMRFESEEIGFGIFRNDAPLALDQQSAGFKWFFELYFNILVKNSMQRGDILIMDEPANKLHSGGRIELRRFMKEFAIKNGVTIVIATQEAELIDIDYLDELRILTLDKNRVHICNDFSSMDVDDPDVIAPIRETLTVARHILCDPEKRPIFVEGITDYNYCVLIRNILIEKYGREYENLAFLPIHGVGSIKDSNIKDKQKKILSKLVKISKRCDPVLLVDADKAGKSIETVAKEEGADIRIIALDILNEGEKKYKEIETLFSTEDRTKLGISSPGTSRYKKEVSLSSNIKTYKGSADISQETLDNFKKLYDILLVD